LAQETQHGTASTTVNCPSEPCGSGDTQCYNTTATQSCTHASGCWAWDTPVGCNQGQVCSGGACIQNQCTPGNTTACSNSNQYGTCSGTQTCQTNHQWGTCTARTPAAEACNGIDDNCNGQADEGLNNSATHSYCVYTTRGWQQVTQQFSITFSPTLPASFTANKEYEYGLGFELLSSAA
jgi:hypothetical protein